MSNIGQGRSIVTPNIGRLIGQLNQQGGGPAPALQCTFTAANTTALASYTPEVGTWYGATPSFGSYAYIYNNALARGPSVIGQAFMCAWNPVATPVTIKADITTFVINAQGMQGLFFRGVTHQQGYAVTLYNQNAYIVRFNTSASWTSLASVAFAFPDNTLYALRAELTGNTIDFYIDDVFKLTATDATYTTGEKVGYMGWYSGAAVQNAPLCDNLEAWT